MPVFQVWAHFSALNSTPLAVYLSLDRLLFVLVTVALCVILRLTAVPPKDSRVHPRLSTAGLSKQVRWGV